MASTWPPPLSRTVLDHFCSGSEKIRWVFAHFRNDDFDTPYIFLFLWFSFSLLRRSRRGWILEAYAIPPTLLSGCVDVNGYRHCADGILVRLNVHQGVWMKLWSASTMIFLFFGGAINADWQCWESRCLAVSGLKRNFLGERLWSLDVAVNRFTLCKPSRR